NRTKPQTGLSSTTKHFGLTSKDPTSLSRVDLSTSHNQDRCARHLLEKLDEFGGIYLDDDTRTLILSMAPDKKQQLIIRNPTIPVTRQTLTDYLINHGRFALSSDRTNIEYRHYDDGRVYRFSPFINDWINAFDESNEQRIVRALGDILSLNGRFLQRADRQIIISLRNGERFIIPSHIGSQLIGPVNGQTVAELLVEYADDIHEEQDGKYLVITLGDNTLRLPQQRQLMSSKPIRTPTKTPVDPKLKLLFPFNKSLREIQKTPSTSTLNFLPPDASNGYAMDPLLMLANYIYRAGTIYQDDRGRLVIKMNEDEIVVPRIEAINAIETINTSPSRTGTIIARLIDRIGRVQSNRAGGLIITIGKSSFEIPKELIDRANQLHRETIDKENDLSINDPDFVQAELDEDLENQYLENDNRRRIVSPRTYYNIQNDATNTLDEQRRPLVVYQNLPNSSSQQPLSTVTSSTIRKLMERSPSTSSLGSDMLIANSLPTHRTVFDNPPPPPRNDRNRGITTIISSNPLSSLTDENYGRPVLRGPV
ncbi:unnamed protein product, partial [Rotaria socialis]